MSENEKQSPYEEFKAGWDKLPPRLQSVVAYSAYGDALKCAQYWADRAQADAVYLPRRARTDALQAEGQRFVAQFFMRLANEADDLLPAEDHSIEEQVLDNYIHPPLKMSVSLESVAAAMEKECAERMAEDIDKEVLSRIDQDGEP